MIPQLNKQYTRRYKPTAEVVSVNIDEDDSTKGSTPKGSVRYRNEFGAECVMTIKQFEEFYE